MNASQGETVSSRAAFSNNRADAPHLPEGWTLEKRRVKVITPAGERWEQITYYKNSIGMLFVLIPAGRFKMGSELSAEETARRFHDKAEVFADEHPQHDVHISKAFLIGVYEVTNVQYRQFRSDHYSGDYEGESLNADLQPATSVSHDDVMAFCSWLSKRQGVACRLPTEAEWEYACRAGSQTPYPWGESISGRYCNFADVNAQSLLWRDETSDDGYAVTAPVGSYPANSFGLYDMIGNVWEWCSDWYGEEYYAESPANDPSGPTRNWTVNRVLRGGSWMNAPSFCRSSFRMKASQANRSANNGFRVVVPLGEE
jgi:sulfatase modifying factor 1